MKERPCTFNVFIHAPLVPRIGRVMKRENIDHMEAAVTIERIDAERAEHCKHFTDTIWGKADAYHLSLDSSFEPSEENATIIASLLAPLFPKRHFRPAQKNQKERTSETHLLRARAARWENGTCSYFPNSAFRHAGGSSFII